jgi:ATP-dependent RNA helicase DDX10/DBP4
LEEYAESLGLPTVPHVKFIPGNKLKQAKNAPHPHIDSSDDEGKKPAAGKTKTDRMFERKNQTVMTKHYGELHSEGNTAFKVNDEEDDGDIFDKKRKINWDTTEIPTGQLPVIPHETILTIVIETAIANGDFKEGIVETGRKRNKAEI